MRPPFVTNASVSLNDTDALNYIIGNSSEKKMSDLYNPKFRVKFLRTITIDNTPIEPGNFIVDMDNGKILVDILSSNNTVRRVSLSGGIIYCGSVPTYNDLPANPSNGDMWNVTETDANYIWSDLENRWDKVGGTIDLSNYYTKTECDNTFITEAQILDLIDQLNTEIPN